LRQGEGPDGLRSVVLGFGGEGAKDGANFGFEVKLDPEVLKRPRPRLLNYDVLQPTVDALNFVQVSATGKIIEIFGRVQNSGGASLIGDASYVDVESPRGVPVRMIPRTTKPTVELVSFNIEVPAFEATTKFYQRAFGLKELKYPGSEPPVQKLSAYLGSDAGGPNLLLSPVPDGRLKERPLDEFEGLLMVAPSASDVGKAASSAAEKALQELAEKEAALKERRRLAKEGGEQVSSLKRLLGGTKAKPSVAMQDKTARVNDGLGNIVFVSDQSDFDRSIA